MRYLVTGGAGFIGSHLVDVLLARGDSVDVLDDLSTGNPINLGHLQGDDRLGIHEGSVLDEVLVDTLVARADVVVHLAAAVGVQLILAKPLESLITNIRGTEILLEACARHGRKVMVASTSEIYGKNGHGAMREDSDRVLGSPLNARWSYSTAKAVDEILAYNYWMERGTPTIIIRLFNCVGPRQTGAYGMVMPRLVRQALNGEDLTVYGDGEQRRCFCHVLDTVGAIVALLDHPGSVGDVFNVGSPNETTINDLAQTVLDLTGSGSRIVHIPYSEAYPRGFEEMDRRIPDTTKLETLTGWKAARSLRQSVLGVIEYARTSQTETAFSA